VFSKDDLVFAVIWPNGDDANMSLIDADGVYLAHVPVKAPVKGADLARMVPKGFKVDTAKCVVVHTNGGLMARTKAPFDTAVVTERRELSFEEKMQSFVRTEVRRQQLRAAKRAEAESILAEEGEGDADRDEEQVTEPEAVEPEKQEDVADDT